MCWLFPFYRSSGCLRQTEPTWTSLLQTSSRSTTTKRTCLLMEEHTWIWNTASWAHLRSGGRFNSSQLNVLVPTEMFEMQFEMQWGNMLGTCLCTCCVCVMMSRSSAHYSFPISIKDNGTVFTHFRTCICWVAAVQRLWSGCSLWCGTLMCLCPCSHFIRNRAGSRH